MQPNLLVWMYGIIGLIICKFGTSAFCQCGVTRLVNKRNIRANLRPYCQHTCNMSIMQYKTFILVLNYGTNNNQLVLLICSCWFWKEEGTKLIREVIWRLRNTFVGEDFVGYFNELVYHCLDLTMLNALQMNLMCGKPY